VSRSARGLEDESGSALLLVLGILLATLAGAVVLGALAAGMWAHGAHQRAADLAALAAARALRDAYPRVFAPPMIARRLNRQHLSTAAYLALGRRVALATAARNGAEEVDVSFPGGGIAPLRVLVSVRDPIAAGPARPLRLDAEAEAELLPPGTLAGGIPTGSGEYRGPLAYRDGKPMRPDVATAYDRMAAAARRAGHDLVVTSGFRTDGEQARLFADRPDPRWVARPGTSLHRLGTELDLGPRSAYGWVAANARRFHFVQRYAWEPWHFGFVLSAGTRSVGYGRSDPTLPSYVPVRLAAAFRRAAQRWSVSAALLAAQARRESGFDSTARSRAGALGIAQFMPGTARAYGLRDPFDPGAAIDAQAHHMRDLLRMFGSVPLALAAYNAGAARVRACMCIPPIPETQAYVADILGLLSGAGIARGPTDGPLVRLVR